MIAEALPKRDLVTISARLAIRALTQRGMHYGWLMVALTFVFGVCPAGAMAIPGTLLTY